MGNELVRIEFHGDAIECVQNDGKVWVSLRRACESLGLSYGAQFAKLKVKPWSVVSLIETTGPDGKIYETTMIDRRTFLMWLAGIDARRIKPESASKIELFQNEAADAIDAHFSGESAAIVPAAAIAALEERVESRLAKQDEKIDRLIESLNGLAQAIANTAQAKATPTGGYKTVEEACQDVRWFDVDTRQKRKICIITNARILHGYGEWPSKIGRLNAYHGHQLRDLFIAVEIVRRQAEREASSAEPDLFSNLGGQN
jgi:HPt (histidine-containing phosphotransfer) domain-containing protein